MKKLIYCLFFIHISIYAQNNDFQIEINTDVVSIVWYHGTDTDITIPNTLINMPVVNILPLAFANKQIKTVTIPDTVISIGDGAFINNQLTNINIPLNVISIGYRAFAGNPVTTITIGYNIRLDIQAFDYNFPQWYNSTGKHAGIYTLISGQWIFSPLP
ncbi:MAG: leucine-rich repeat domain-containing protein [Treponema sp.]|jgi:hypothetical protein|nr:leucine-rich repeat domain-containing protein [Treponema sp.]